MTEVQKTSNSSLGQLLGDVEAPVEVRGIRRCARDTGKPTSASSARVRREKLYPAAPTPTPMNSRPGAEQ